MSALVLYYSHSGNNRLFAGRIAERTGARLAEVRARGWRTFLSIVRDMSKDRRPPIAPLDADPGDFERVLLVAPVWDMQVAKPMVTALEAVGDRIGRYAFASLCGYVREGQTAALSDELTARLGHPPEAVLEAFVGELVPESQRGNPLRVSRRRVTAGELDRFEDVVGRAVSWLSA